MIAASGDNAAGIARGQNGGARLMPEAVVWGVPVVLGKQDPVQLIQDGFGRSRGPVTVAGDRAAYHDRPLHAGRDCEIKLEWLIGDNGCLGLHDQGVVGVSCCCSSEWTLHGENHLSGKRTGNFDLKSVRRLIGMRATDLQGLWMLQTQRGVPK